MSETAPDPSAEIPARHSDATANRPPAWLWRALVMGIVAVFLAIGVWYALGALRTLGVYLLLSFFLSLALEPVVSRLVRRGWKRSRAAITTLLGAIAVVGIVMALFGNLFVSQLVALISTIPQLYADASVWLSERFDVVVPEPGDLLHDIVNQHGMDVASGALLVGTTVLGLVFASLTIGLVTYYLLASGPRFRAAICRYLTPNRQNDMLRYWEITQTKVSDFLATRVVLAAISTVATAIFLLVLQTPYALPLALFTGLISQFVPTIGTYLGGALPVAVALTSQGLTQGILVLAFIIAYQQVENLWLSPKISAKALEMNPAVSFVVVIAFGSVFGALGAFLALPIAATIQAIASTYIRRHELVTSPMLDDPVPGFRKTELDD
ncbi:AI-2E family transporter [Salana multivorans]